MRRRQLKIPLFFILLVLTFTLPDIGKYNPKKSMISSYDNEQNVGRKTIEFGGNDSQSDYSYLGVKGRIRHFNKAGDYFQILLWSAEPSLELDSIHWEAPVEVLTANSKEMFMNNLPNCSAAFVLGSADQDLGGQILSSETEGLLNWVSMGNLLFITGDGFRNCSEGLKSLFSVTEISPLKNNSFVEVFKKSALTGGNNVRIGPLSRGKCFEIALEDQPTVISRLKMKDLRDGPITGVLAKQGKGYAIIFGFGSAFSASVATDLKRLMITAFKEYALVYAVIFQNWTSGDTKFSPFLYPMADTDPYLQQLKECAQIINENGFWTSHSNLKSYYKEDYWSSSIQIKGSLSLFDSVFNTTICIRYDDSVKHINSTPLSIPQVISSRIRSVELPSRVSLHWPPGWAPPQVDYYHLAPNEAAVVDMGADEWAPRSVERVVGALKQSHQFGYNGSGIHVGVIDTGFSNESSYNEYNTTYHYHPFYEEYYTDLFESGRYHPHKTVFTIKDPYPRNYTYWPFNDQPGHGTGITANLLAVAPGIDLHVWSKGWDDRFIIDALDQAINISIDVLSCSWGFPYLDNGSHDEIPEGVPAEMLTRIRELARIDTIVVFSAGNEDQYSWPGSEPCVVSAGGVYVDANGNFQASNYASSFNSTLYPGRHDTTDNDDGWFVASGTSSAAPQIAGLAAIIKQIDPTINVGQFKYLAGTSATDVITGKSWKNETAGLGKDLPTGFGLLNVCRTVWTYLSAQPYEPTTLPLDHHYNFYTFTYSGLPAYHIDTIGGPSQSGYWFFGFSANRTNTFVVDWTGKLHITGNFRQNDTFNVYLQPGRRHLKLFVLSCDATQTIMIHEILDYTNGTSWHWVDTIIDGLPAGEVVRLGVGRRDSWSTDWKLTAEWSNVTVHDDYFTASRTIPSGQPHHFYSIDTPVGVGDHIDTINQGYSQAYHFVGYIPELIDLEHSYLEVSGWFRQDDTFSPSLQPGRRKIFLYVLDSDYTILETHLILEWFDGTGWVHRTIRTDGMDRYVYLAVGRRDAWAGDWKLVAEWCKLSIQIVNE